MTTNNAFADQNDNVHYITYTVKFWRPISSSATIIIFFVTACWFLTTDRGPLSEKIFISAFVVFFGGLLLYVFTRYLSSSKQKLQIAIDAATFYFGNDINQNKYNKDSIEKITIYQPGNPKPLQYFYVFEILFKDESIIKFSNMMISESKVLENFPSDLIRYGGDKHSFWRL